MDLSRNALLAGATAVAATAIASSAFAQASATTSANASVAITAVIDVKKDADLTFGRVIRPTAGNTTVYTVSETNGQASTAGGNGTFTTGGGTPGRAAFTVNGDGGQAFNISSDPSVTAGGVTINLVKSGASGTLDGTVGATGTATFGVGGNVTLDSTAAPGVKSGSFNVTVSYP
jgi:hypothetical protein